MSKTHNVHNLRLTYEPSDEGAEKNKQLSPVPYTASNTTFHTQPAGANRPVSLQKRQEPSRVDEIPSTIFLGAFLLYFYQYSLLIEGYMPWNIFAVSWNEYPIRILRMDIRSSNAGSRAIRIWSL
jgi:hypothetical protein